MVFEFSWQIGAGENSHIPVKSSTIHSLSNDTIFVSGNDEPRFSDCVAFTTDGLCGRGNDRCSGEKEGKRERAWHTNKVVLMPVQERGRKVGGSLGYDSSSLPYIPYSIARYGKFLNIKDRQSQYSTMLHQPLVDCLTQNYLETLHKRAPLTSVCAPAAFCHRCCNRDLSEIIVVLSFWFDTHLPPCYYCVFTSNMCLWKSMFAKMKIKFSIWYSFQIHHPTQTCILSISHPFYRHSWLYHRNEEGLKSRESCPCRRQ